MCNPNIQISELTDLELDVEYGVRKYKQVYGSCGLMFIIQAVKSGSNTPIYVQVRDGNLHEYLVNKTDEYRFIIKRENAENCDSHIIIDNCGKWVNLRVR